MNSIFTRREAIATMGAGLSFISFIEAERKKGIGIGACDWSIDSINKPEAAEMAQKIGLDGVQVNLGNLANEMHLRNPKIQQQYIQTFKERGIKFSGLAIGELNNIPYKSDDRTDQWVVDSIDVAKVLGVKIVLLAFFANNDLKNDEKGTATVIEKLKKVMPIAEKNGVTIGIESWLDAREHQYIIEAVQSPNLKVYYDVANSNKMGYDIYSEIRELGKKNLICEFHAKENGFLLGKGKVDFQEVKKCMEEIKYRGWIQIEGAVPEGAEILPSYIENRNYLKSIFPKK
jgi:L-ribulose-5-phosphate 3-epimerase